MAGRRQGTRARPDPFLQLRQSLTQRRRLVAEVVVNLERVRAVITTTEVLIPGPRDPAVEPLVRELHARRGAAA